MSEKRRERELLKRAESQRRWRPGDDEFDQMSRDWWVMPGLGMMWIIVVRSWRAIERKLSAKSRRSSPPLWTIAPRPLDKEE